MSKRRLIVTGCGRSGTQFMAALLNALGIKCRHERIYTSDLNPYDLLDRALIEARWNGHDAEVSWLAVPFLPVIKDAVIVHLVRDPLKVLCCWNTHQLLSKESDISRFIKKYVLVCGDGPDIDRNIAYCLYWNRLLETNCAHLLGFRYRVENLAEMGFSDCLKVAGYNISDEDLSAAVSSIPTDIGKCPDMHVPEPTWRDIITRPLGGALKEMAHLYGYSTSVDT